MSSNIVPELNISIRLYQRDFIEKVSSLLFSGKKVLGQLPTQSGKTVCFALISREFINRNPTSSVLVIAHRRELIKQAHSKISKITNEPVGMVLSGIKPDNAARYQVASIGSIDRRQDAVGNPGLIIIDECHHCVTNSYQNIISRFPDALLLGVTATPVRLDGIGFKDTFDELVNGEQPKELIINEYLSSYRYFAAPDPMSTDGCGTKDGDFKIADIERVNNVVNLSANIIDSYRKHADGKQSVVFAVSVAFAREIADRFNAAGITAAVIYGQQSNKQRDLEIEKFKNKINKVLVNCQLIDEGFSVPSIECVQIARPTKSLVRQLQSIGRGMAIEDGKSELIIIDHTQNYQRFGLPDLNRVWSLNGVSSENIVLYRTPDREIVETKDSLCVIENDLVELIEIDRSRLFVLSDENIELLASGKQTAKSMSDRLGINKNTVCVAYKRQTGRLLAKKFVISDEDIKSLANKDQTTKEIAAKIGTSHHVVANAYKRQTGLSLKRSGVKQLSDEDIELLSSGSETIMAFASRNHLSPNSVGRAYKLQTGRSIVDVLVLKLSAKDIELIETREETLEVTAKRLGCSYSTVFSAYKRQTGKSLARQSLVLSDEDIEILTNGKENAKTVASRLGCSTLTILNSYKRQTGKGLRSSKRRNL